MGEVVAIESVKFDECAEVVNFLRESLERAENGEVLAVALVEVRRGGAVATAWTCGNSHHFLNSGAARLASRLARTDDK